MKAPVDNRREIVNQQQSMGELRYAMETKIQVVIVTLDDGRELYFSGRVYPDVEDRKVTAVRFVEPMNLAPECRLEPLETILG